MPIVRFDDANIVTDLHGVVVSCNDAAERLLGYTASEIVGRSIKVLIPLDRQDEEDRFLERLRAGQPVGYFETLRITKDGRLLDVGLTPAAVLDESNRIVGAWRALRDISQHRRATAAQAHLAAIVASSDDAIISKDLDGIIQSCNASAERLFGYRADELIGRPVRILIPPERQTEEDYILGQIRRGEKIDHFETVRVTRDGRRLDISLTVSPVFDLTGAIIGVSKVARDITERKRAQAELAAQQEWFRVTLGSIGDAVIASDPHGVVTYMNGQAEDLTGWTLDAAGGQPLVEVFHILNEETGQRVENPAALVMRSGRVVGLANHTVLVSRDGSSRPIADSAAPIRDADGRILGVVLVFRDVSGERRAERAVAEQREWLQTTLESIGDAVIATDVGGRIVFMNSVAERLTGWRTEVARGRTCDEVFRIVDVRTRRLVTSPVTRVLAEGAVVGLASHTVLIAADGSERPIDDSGAPIRDRDGRLAGVVLVFRDVSERRRLEAERQAAALERERTLEAERAARAEAERASQVKDEFVAMVSHELRTPLNAILGWAQLMMNSRHDPAVVERGLEVVARNTRLQAQLISDLLDVSRIAAGKLQLDLQVVDLAAIVTDAIETVQHEAAAKGVEIRPSLARELGPVAGDPARLQQVMWNLLSNAIKFSPAGGQIRVGLRREGRSAEISVTDTGVGIKPDVLPHIFDRFHQADRSITRQFGGLGLGLSIVKHVVQLHGGRVTAQSAGEGTGARFTIQLPMAAAPGEISAAPDRDPQAQQALEAISLQGLRVLVVEDEPDTREFLVRLLQAHGARVMVAESATEALSAFQDAPPDIVVSDIGLPEVDGYDLMQRIRQMALPGADAVPAIALTAYARAEDRTRALRAGYNAHVSKPVEPAELVATIASFAALIEPQREEGAR